MIYAYIGSALYGDIIGYFLTVCTREGTRKAAPNALRVPIGYLIIATIFAKSVGVTIPEAVVPLVPIAGTCAAPF